MTEVATLCGGSRMGCSKRISVKIGSSSQTDARLAVAELAGQITQPDMSGLIFYCSSKYDLAELGHAIAAAFNCPITGCTTSGEITADGYIQHSLVGASLASTEMKLHTQLIKPVSTFDLEQASNLAAELKGELAFNTGFNSKGLFGLLLIDGLSMSEERAIASLYHSFERIPLLGGSAGDDQAFEQTYVYHGGEFHEDAAVFTLCETTLPFRVFRTQHFEPTSTKLVITDSDPPRRIVSEINGCPAAEEYARAVGLEAHELTPMIFSAHPLMLKIGGEYYVRSIQKVNPDGSLTFYCAIDNGLVLTVAKGVDIISNLQQQVAKLRSELGEISLVIGNDCILRRLEVFDKGLQQQVKAVLAPCNFLGFSTYGEQFNAVHVNQTLTGVAIGG